MSKPYKNTSDIHGSIYMRKGVGLVVEAEKHVEIIKGIHDELTVDRACL